jgi:hypothetical protein
MVETHNELIMEIAMETGLDHMGEDAEDEDEDEDDDDGGGTVTPPIAVAPPLLLCHMLLPLRRSSRKKTPWRWFPSKKPLWRMKLSWQMLSLSCCSPVSIAHSRETMSRAR